MMLYRSFFLLALLALGAACGPDANNDEAYEAEAEGGFIVAGPWRWAPGDLREVSFSTSIPMYFRLMDETHKAGPWVLWNQAAIKKIRLKKVQFAIKDGDFGTPQELRCHFVTNFDDYYKKNIISRSQWGAREPKGDMKTDKQKYFVAIHHTAGNASSQFATLQSIQNDHMDRNKWADIGYHFLISLDEKCFEGRDLSYQGAHVLGHNPGSIGMSFLGSFDSSQLNNMEPTRGMIERMGELIGVLGAHYGIDISHKTIKGHQEFAGAKTLCPGDLIMARMDEILAKAAKTKQEILLN